MLKIASFYVESRQCHTLTGVSAEVYRLQYNRYHHEESCERRPYYLRGLLIRLAEPIVFRF